MRVTRRVHEWLAERVPWIQYPDARFPQERKLLFKIRSMAAKVQNLTWKQKGWLLFALFWGSLIALSIFGNLLD